MSETDEHAHELVSGIYEIRNRHSGRVYIGKSKNIHGRWLAHRYALDRGLHINGDLQGDWEIFGSGAFEFTILEEVMGLKALWNAEAHHFAAASDTYNAMPIYEMRERQVMSRSPITPQQLIEALCGIRLPVWLSESDNPLEDLAVFHDAGYQGMYNGERENDIHARKGLAPGESILDWMGSTELAANLFRITQTEDKLRRGAASTREGANQVHHDMGKAVRQFILDQGGTPPEQLPTPDKSIHELQRQEQKRIEAERQPPLFDDVDSDDQGY